LLLVVSALIALVRGQGTPVEEQKVLASPPTFTLQVEANRAWQDTHVEVDSRRPVLIRARGRWRSGTEDCPPEGLADSPRDRAVLPQANRMCLLVRIGNDEVPLAAGSRLSFTPTRSGRLFVQANDLDLNDNGGSLTVDIQGGRTSPADAPPPGPTPVEAAEAELRALPPVASLGGNRDTGWRQAGSILRKYPGTLQATRAAEWFGTLLSQTPSPFDALDPRKIPAEEQFPWQPRELVALLGSHRQRHWAAATAVAVSHDGSLIASGGADEQIRVWDVESMKERTVLKGHRGAVLSVAFAPNQVYLVSGGQDGLVRVWDRVKGTLVRELKGHAGPVVAVAALPGGTRFLSAGADRTVRLWDGSGGKELRKYEGAQQPLTCLAVTADGRRAFAGGTDRVVRGWDIETGEVQPGLEHPVPVTSLAAVSGGRRLLVGCGDGRLVWWELEARTIVRSQPAQLGAITALAASADGELVLTARADGQFRIIDSEGRERGILPRRPGPGAAAAFAPDKRFAVTAHGDGTVRRWNIDTGDEISPPAPEPGALTQVAFAAADKRVLLGRVGLPLLNWDPLGPTVAAGPADVAAFPRVPCFTPDCSLGAYIASDRSIRVIELASRKELHRLEGVPADPTGLALFADGRRAITAGTDRSLRVWDLELGKELRQIPTNARGVMRTLALTADGRWLFAGGDDNLVHLWDVEAGKVVRQFKGHTGPVTSVGVTFDGKRLISAGRDGLVRLWDVTAAEARKSWTCPGPVLGAAISADGRYVATANGNGTVYLLRVRPS
jgi:WD40 repeat protein